jgi:predicted nucleic acid-binding protein
VALCDARDALHERALSDLNRVGRRRLIVIDPVYTEAWHLIEQSFMRARLVTLARRLPLLAWAPEDPEHHVEAIFAWLEHYAEHDPDWADAALIVAVGRSLRARIWTYDREFTTLWKAVDGKNIPLFGTMPEHPRRRRQ